ncbi:MAG: peptidase dimerization domain-containing protein [Christensenellales bacterium]
MRPSLSQSRHGRPVRRYGERISSGGKRDERRLYRDRQRKTYTVTARGKEGHAMNPDDGENAIWKIFALLRGLYPASRFVSGIWDKLCRYDAAGVLELGCEDASGKLTINLGWAKTELGLLTLGFDFRIPISVSPEDVESWLLSAFLAGR